MMEVIEVMDNKLVVTLMDPATYPPSDIGQNIKIMSTHTDTLSLSVLSDSNASTDLPTVFDIVEDSGQHLQVPNVTSSITPSNDGRCSVNSQTSSKTVDHFDAGKKFQNMVGIGTV